CGSDLRRGGRVAALLAAAGDRLPQREQDEGGGHGDQKVAEAKVVAAADAQQVGGYEAANQRARDAQDHRPKDADRLVALAKQPSDRPDEKPPYGPRNDGHAGRVVPSSTVGDYSCQRD